jgi:hypothetical protein
MTSELCLAWEVGLSDLSQVENPFKPNRDQWLNNLAYANWTLEEVRNGTVWKRFRPQVEQLIK